MLAEMLDLFVQENDFFVKLLFEHLQITLTAFVIAVIFGGIFGIVISHYRKASSLTLGMVNLLYTIPSISMLGFLIPFSGIGDATAIIALTIYALLPMVRNTYTGITQLDATILEAAKAMGSTHWQMLYKIKLPLAFPIIFSGIRSMMTMTVALGGIASFIGAGGLGVAIYRGITTNNTTMTMVGSVLIALLALVWDFLFTALESFFKVRRKSRRRKIIFSVLTVLGVAMALIFTNALLTQKAEVIRIASKPMTEQYILSEMLALLIEEKSDLKVELTQGVGGGTANIHPAMLNKEFDICIDYTGTAWNMVLKQKSMYQEKFFSTLTEEYSQRFNLQWVGMYGFNNTYGVVVRNEIAKQYNLKTYSDLQAVSKKLVFGAGYDFFGRVDGFKMLCDAYGLTFGDTMAMEIGLKYQAINEDKIDVMNVFTTDGQLSVSDVLVLQDDKHLYPSYLCGNIVRKEVLDKHPELANILTLLQGRIADKDIAHMNYQVESKGQTPRQVAQEFLQGLGLLQKD